MRLWRCWRCGRPFAHARHLVTHLTDFHGETVPV